MSNTYPQIFVTPWGRHGGWMASVDVRFSSLVRQGGRTVEHAVANLRRLVEYVPMNGYIPTDAEVVVVPPSSEEMVLHTTTPDVPADRKPVAGTCTLTRDEHNHREYTFAGMTWYTGWSIRQGCWVLYRWTPTEETPRKDQACPPDPTASTPTSSASSGE